jgi:hypothetical protein
LLEEEQMIAVRKAQARGDTTINAEHAEIMGIDRR